MKDSSTNQGEVVPSQPVQSTQPAQELAPPPTPPAESAPPSTPPELTPPATGKSKMILWLGLGLLLLSLIGISAYYIINRKTTPIPTPTPAGTPSATITP